MNTENTTQKLSWYQKNKERAQAHNKAYCQINKKRLKERRQSLKEQTRARERKYYHENREMIIKRNIDYQRNKYRTDINYKLSCLLRSRFNQTLKAQRTYKTNKIVSLLGCSLEEFKQYIEKLWLPGMNWENYNLYHWHIDHIKPVNTFDITDLDQQKECFHYSNLRPLWAHENWSRPRDGSDLAS